MVRETDFAKQRALMREFEKHVLDTEAHEIFLLWRYRIVPHRSYVKGWKISPSHYVNQDLATIWLDRLTPVGCPARIRNVISGGPRSCRLEGRPAV